MSDNTVVSIGEYTRKEMMPQAITTEEKFSNLIQQQMFNMVSFSEKAEEFSENIDDESVENKIANSMKYAVQFIKCIQDLQQELDHKSKM